MKFKGLSSKIQKQSLVSILLLIFISLVFFWKFFLKRLIPIPADIVVGIYYPWRDHIWGGYVAGVPFKNGLLSDVVSIIYPWRIYGIELLKKGIWPLWISHPLAGSPLLANFQSGLLYPLNFLFFTLSNVDAWSIYIIFQPVLASIFCYLFLKNLKLSNFASLIGSFIFAFSGFMLVWLEYGIVGHAGLWLPLVLLVIDKLFEKVSFGWLSVGVLAVVFSIFAGYPQVTFSIFLVSLFYAGYKNYKKAIFYILPFFLLGIFFSAIQLLPGLELWRHSIRQVDPTITAFNFGLSPLKNLILLLAPDFYGNPATGNFWGWGAYNESAFYVSVAGLLLAIIAFFGHKKEKTLVFLKILLVFSLLMVFENPISKFVFNLRLPILASSSAGRFLFLTDFSLAVLAAFGGELLLTKRKIFKSLFPLLLVLIPFLIILVIVFLKPQFWQDKDLMGNLAVVKRNLILPTVLFVSSLILLIFPLLKPFLKFKKIIVTLLFLVIIFDLFRFGWKYNPFTPKEFLYPETKLTRFLQENDGVYRFVGLIPQSMWIPYNIFSPEGYEPLMIKRYSEFANQINEEKFEKISPGSRWVIFHRYDSPLLDLLGVKYFLNFNPEPQNVWDHQYFKYPENKYKLIFQYGKSQVYERKNVLPRAFIVHDFKFLTDEEILKTLMDKNFSPAKTLLLEEEPENLPQEKLTIEEAVIDKNFYFDNQVLIRTKSGSDGFLFLSDTYYPGWRVLLDGKETRIYHANYAFRAIFLPSGEHIIRFIYDPLSFKIGLYLSCGALVVLVFGGIGLYLFKKEWW